MFGLWFTVCDVPVMAISKGFCRKLGKSWSNKGFHTTDGLEKPLEMIVTASKPSKLELSQLTIKANARVLFATRVHELISCGRWELTWNSWEIRSLTRWTHINIQNTPRSFHVIKWSGATSGPVGFWVLQNIFCRKTRGVANILRPYLIPRNGGCGEVVLFFYFSSGRKIICWHRCIDKQRDTSLLSQEHIFARPVSYSKATVYPRW